MLGVLRTTNKKRFGIGTKINLVGLALVLVPTVIVGALLLTSYYEALVDRQQTQMEASLHSSVVKYRRLVVEAERDATFLTKLPPPPGIIRARANGGIDPRDGSTEAAWLDRLGTIFEGIMISRPHYGQVRLIGAADDGLELVRVNREGPDVVRVEKDQLQRKDQRDYFQKAITLPPEGIFVTEAELNREHGVIQDGVQVVRFCAPVIDEETRKTFGIIVINVDFKALLDLSFNESHTIGATPYVANREGDVLLHPDPSKTFQFEYGSRFFLRDEFPSLDLSNTSAANKRLTIPDSKGDEHFLVSDWTGGTQSGNQHTLLFALAIPSQIAIAPAIEARNQAILIAFAITLFALIGLLFFSRSIARPLLDFSRVLDRIGDGDYQAKIEYSGSKEMANVAGAINDMAVKLKEADTREAESWITTHAHGVISELQSANSVEDWATTLIARISKALVACLGCVYILDEECKRFVLSGSYALDASQDRTNKSSFALGEGLVGQAAQNGEPLLLTKVPEGYFKIASGLGQAHPNALLLVPLHFQDHVVAVIELAGFRDFSERAHALLERIGGTAMIALANIRSRLETELLLEETRRQSEILNEQQRDLSEANDELKEQARLLRESEEELLRAREVADTANRAKSDFLANMSHEIRTPMNAIIGMSHLVLKSNIGARERDFVGKIEVSAQALMGIINDLLDFSKIEAGKLEIEVTEFDLDNVIDNVSSLIAVSAAEKDLEVFFVEGHEVPTLLLGDPLRLGQILTNITINAIKFTDVGEVVVRVELVERRVNDARLRFTISDTGIGMSESHLAQLFQPFSQADSSTSRKRGGTGLGLSIVKHLVARLGGEISVTSELGKGSTFTFEASFGLQSAQRDTVKVLSSGDNLSKILIVDDNQTAREILSEIIESLGLTPIVAASAHEALALCNDPTNCDGLAAIMVDWKMPGMDGIDFAKAFRKAHQEHHDIPVILVTAHGNATIEQEAAAAGVAPVLFKPLTPSRVHDAVLTAIQRRGRRETAQDRANRQRRTPSETQSRLSGLHLLVAEDHPINQQIVEELLRDAGAKVTLANDGAQAIELASQEPWDAILMDIQMPNIDGLSAAKQIRAKLSDAPPIIAMTAHALRGDREKSLAAGMVDHVTKPIDPRSLIATVEKWTKRKQIPTPFSPALAIDEEESDFDPDACIARLLGKRTMFAKVLERYNATIVERAQDFQRHILERDYPPASLIAHNLQGASAYSGAIRIAKVAADADVILRNGNLIDHVELSALAEDLVREAESFSRKASKWLKENPVPPPAQS